MRLLIRMQVAMETKAAVYHEKQRLQFCLLHALNNLMQAKDSFTRAELDVIADKLVLDDPSKEQWTPLSLIFRPHHNTLTGNYDVNVLITALEARGKRVVWHDRRNGASSINLAGDTLIGIMLNVTVRRFIGFWRGRHWVALRNISGVWYNLDSDLGSPEQFQNEKEVTTFLDNKISQGGEVLIVLHGDEK
ncbi:josephin-like protein isoform X1 [Ananas comosus]|uniref:ubiquitinyl hydrolase 1 n=3 Tax=Ananas comosus TaxID=4615 RepID=A0A6P5F1B1_ANACO|nr:josephin-like protein isoform X1 [Ananas comosus]XP_020087147.1 josephin-like protein isoform X1 [Ananas comosus]